MPKVHISINEPDGGVVYNRANTTAVANDIRSSAAYSTTRLSMDEALNIMLYQDQATVGVNANNGIMTERTELNELLEQARQDWLR